MRKSMKQQLLLTAILFIAMGCNNSPNAEQTSNQQNIQQDSVETLSNTSATTEKVQIDNDIRAIDNKIAELEKAEKLRIAEEINLIQQKITDLEVKENEIETAITRLENQIYQAETASTTPELVAKTKATAPQTKPEETVAIQEAVEQEQLTVADNENSVFGWGDWEKGIQPAAGGPTPVTVAKVNVQAPDVNFRPNENSAFTHQVLATTPAQPVVGNTPPAPVPSAIPATGDPRARR